MTVHAVPTIVACCHVPVDLLADDDRISSNPNHVDCRLLQVDGVAEHLARQIWARHPDRTPEWVGNHVGLSGDRVARMRVAS